VQGKVILSFVPPKIVESWLECKGPSQIGQEQRPSEQTITKINDIFARRGNIEGNK